VTAVSVAACSVCRYLQRSAGVGLVLKTQRLQKHLWCIRSMSKMNYLLGFGVGGWVGGWGLGVVHLGC